MSGAPRDLPRSIVVAGGGTTAVLAAVALRRALPATDVTVLAAPVDPAAFADHAGTALPFSVRLLERLGFPEAEIVQRCGGSHRLVNRYLGWAGDGLHGVAAYGSRTELTGFARDWGGGATGADTAAATVSLAQVLAEAGRFAPVADSGPLATVDYALRWNTGALRDLAIAQAQALGVRHRPGLPRQVRLDEDGRALAFALEDGGELAADLFTDSTGPAALLLAQMPGARRIDWSAQLPVRQVVLAQPGAPMAVLEDRLTLSRAGWLSETAGRDGLQRLSLIHI